MLTVLALLDGEVSDRECRVFVHAYGDHFPLQAGRPPHHKRLQAENGKLLTEEVEHRESDPHLYEEKKNQRQRRSIRTSSHKIRLLC